MWNQFFLQQIHYALHILGALVFFSVGWLYLDARDKRHPYLIARIAGFMLLAVSSLVSALPTGLSGSFSSIVPTLAIQWFTLAAPVIAYFCIFLSFPQDRIMKKPVHPAVTLSAGAAHSVLAVLKPIGAFAVAATYYVYVAEGLEWHLLLPSIGFFAITLSEVAATYQAIMTNMPPGLLSVLWWTEHLFLFAGITVLLRWVFWYLLKRFDIQLSILSATAVTVLTVVVTSVFAIFLYGNVFSGISSQTSTSVKVFSYGIASRKREALADARFISLDTRVGEAISANNVKTLTDIIREYALGRTIRDLMVLDPRGAPMARNDADGLFSDMSRFGHILSTGTETATVVRVPGIATPMLYIAAAVPVKKDGQAIGTILVTQPLDDAFVKGMKRETGLDAFVFSGTTLSATSHRNAGSLVGLSVTDRDVEKNVLSGNMTREGITDLGDMQYLGTYLPVTDSENKPVGMLFVGHPLETVRTMTTDAVGSTYAIGILLIILSVAPALLLSRYIMSQLR